MQESKCPLHPGLWLDDTVNSMIYIKGFVNATRPSGTWSSLAGASS
jgi:hypothetical protein